MHRTLIALTLVCLLGLTACSSSDPADDGTASTSATTDDPTSEEAGAPDAAGDPDAVLRYAVPGVAQSLDPRTANEFQQIFLEQIYEPLIRTTPDGDYEPGLALEWALVDDGAAFELTLREGVTFQDGEPFDADAVVANIEGARAEGSNLAGELAVVDAAVAVDEHIVRLELNGPGGHMTGILAGYPGMMISPAAFDTDLQTSPVGAGPFTLVDANDTSVVLEAWDGYYAADELTIGGLDFSTFTDEAARLRALRSGQLDGAFLAPSQVEEAESSGLEVVTTPQTSVHGMLLNTAHEALGNDLVRQAIMAAIDREGIAEALYGGRCTPTVQPYPSEYWAYDPALADSDLAGYDVEGARALLADAGYPDGFAMTLSSYPQTVYQRLAEAFQQQLADIGIDAEIEVATDLSAQRRAGEYDVVVGPFQAGRPDPSIFLEDHYTPDGRVNFGGVAFEGVEELIAESRRATDTAERSTAIAGVLEQTVAQGPLVVPACIPNIITALREGVGGIVTSVLGNRDFRRATVPPS